DLLELIEVEHEEHDLALRLVGVGEPAGEMLIKRVTVRKPCQRVVLGKILDALRFPLSIRDVAKHRAVLESLDALPSGEARLQREKLAALAAPFELHDSPVRRQVL